MKKPLFPRYSYFPCAILVLMHFVSYYGTQFISADRPHHYVSLPIDALWPLCPVWIFVYILTFLFWIAGAAMIMREDKERCYELFSCFMLAELICLLFYIFYPTVMTRPELSGDRLAEKLLSIIYVIDEPCNLLPSMHCMMSWMFFRASQRCENVKKPWVIFCGIMAVLICLSTQFIKQHVFADLVLGVLLGELCLFVGCRFRLGRLLFRRS